LLLNDGNRGSLSILRLKEFIEPGCLVTFVDKPAFGPVPGPANAMESLQPNNPAQLQTESYNQFCRSILEVCGVYIAYGPTKSLPLVPKTMTGSPPGRPEQGSHWPDLRSVGIGFLKSPNDPEPGESYPLCDLNPSNSTFDSSTAGPSLTGGIPQHHIGPNTTESIQLRAVEMARLLLQFYPGNWIQGKNVALAGQLRYFVNGRSVEWGLNYIGDDRSGVF
jgi:hypothetical protein